MTFTRYNPPTVRRFLLLLALAALPAAPLQAATPEVLFEHGDVVRTADEVHVRDGLVQLELAPGIVASAKTGARFALSAEAPDARDLVVFTGVVNIVDTRVGGMAELIAGRYSLRFAPALEVSTPRDATLLGQESRGFLLSDVGWARQNDALMIPTQPLVQGIFGAINPVLRSFFGRPAPQH